MPVTKRTRFEVLRRDGYQCRYCHRKDNELTVDHVTPTSLGGADTPENLVACCMDCNAGKASSHPDTPLVADVSEDAKRWAEARKIAAQRVSERRDRWSKQCQKFRKTWRVWDEDCTFLPADWKQSVVRWLDNGVPYDRIAEAHSIAIEAYGVPSRTVFRYIAGVIKNIVKEIEAETAAILRAGDDG
ncbi:HNH endonuclease [Clostridioides difficile]